MFVLICLIIAAVLLFLAAVGVGAPRVHLGWLGLFFCVLTVIIPKL